MRYLAFALALAGCGTPPPVATAADASRTGIELAALTRGRDLLLERCGGCHDVPVPKQRAAADWPRQVAEMAPKAGIDASQQALITQYLVALAPK